MIKVKAAKKLMSDDRAKGIDDGSPIIYPGTVGELIGNSKKFCSRKAEKENPKLWLVKFPKVSHNWYLTRDEFVLLNK